MYNDRLREAGAETHGDVKRVRRETLLQRLSARVATESDIRDLDEFKKFDKDKSGTLNFNEYCQRFSGYEMGVNQVIWIKLDLPLLERGCTDGGGVWVWS